MAVHLIGVLFLLVACVLLIIVSVGTPVWKEIAFLKADLGGSTLYMGNWGYCIGNSCTKAKLGYDLTLLENYQSGDTSAKVAASVVHGLTFALILTPIAAAISLAALLLAVCNNLVTGILSSLVSFFAFLVTIVSFGIDLGLFVTARHRLNDTLSGSPAHLANAMWMVLVAVLCQLLAACTVCFVSRSHRRRRDLERSSVAAPPTVPPMVEPRRRFWQRGGAYY